MSSSYELEDPGPTRTILERNAEREKKKRQQGDHLPRTNGMTPSLKLTEPVRPFADVIPSELIKKLA